MTSSKQYLEYVLEQLSEVDEVTYRAMMGEYIIYYQGKSSEASMMTAFL